MIKNVVGWIVFLCVLLAALLGGGKIIYDEGLQKQVFSRHAHLIKTARTLLHEHLMQVVQDTHQLSSISCTQRYLEAPTSDHLTSLKRIFIDTANIYGRYDQIRVLSLKGKEMLRIEHKDFGAYAVPKNQLQDKSDRYYVKEGLKLRPGQVYLSPLDLNIERGVVEMPLKPTIRLVRMMANSQGEPTALLILNYKAKEMLSQFIQQFPAVDRAMLLNSQGYWLANHESANEWGWMLGHPERTLQQWSPTLWQAVQAKRTGTFAKDEDLFTFNKVDIASIYNDTSHARYVKDLGLISDIKASIWTILIQTDKEDWQERAIYNSLWFRSILIGFLLALMFIAYLLVRNQYQRQLNNQLQHQQLEDFRDLYENAPIGYITLSAEGLITNVNKILLSYLACSRDEIVNRLYLSDLVDAESQTAVKQLLLTLSDSQERHSRMTMVSANENKIDVLCHISLRTEKGMPLAIGRCSVHDISEQVRLEQRLERLARKDSLTGLDNRRYFDETSQIEFDRAQSMSAPLAAIIFDIDHFKQVNDTYGHGAGDEVLKAVAACCQKMLRATDIFARMGGEEFVVLLPHTSLEQAVQKAERIRQTLSEMVLVLAIDNKVSIQITVSLGVASLSEKKDNIKKLLFAADSALYQAKRSGRNRVVSDTQEKTSE